MNFPFVPDQASEFAEKYDRLFGTITALSLFFTVVVMVLVIYFAVRFRVGSKANRERPQHENLKVEIAWTAPPLVLGLAIFLWGAMDFVYYKQPPKDAMEIFVIGKQWMWHIQHPNGVREMNELHVPVGKPVKVTMISQDVIHAFYLPQFRVQYQVVPGRYTEMWFTPTKPGKYNMFCGMHCGTGHSEMGGYVYAMPQAEYAEWLERGGSNPPERVLTLAEEGQALFDQLQCGNCHGSEDTDRGPTLVGIAGKQRRLANGRVRRADDEYLRENIIDPHKELTAGYINTMPLDYSNTLTEEQIRYLIEFIKVMGVTPTAATGLSATGDTPIPHNEPASNAERASAGND